MTPAHIRAALKSVGEQVTFCSPQGELTFSASIQPELRLQGEESSPLGAGRKDRAVLYAPADSVTRCLRAGDCLRAGATLYRVLQTQTRRLLGEDLYLWAALEQWEETP